MEEVWKDVEGFEGLYQVSNLGRVKSLRRVCDMPRNGDGCKRVIRERILKTDKADRSFAVLSRDKVKTMVSVHRLVARAFVDGYMDGLVVNHIDGNPKNNRADNLEWCTQSQNVFHANRGGGRYEDYHTVRIVQYDMDGQQLRVWGSYDEIEKMLGISKTAVCACCRGRHYSCKGYRWSYENSSPISFSRRKVKAVKAVEQKSMEGDVICTYSSFADASRSVGVSKTTIRNACYNPGKVVRGCLWDVVCYGK